mmetsp:Transcript_23324/g.48545  ORF Transcript_23324/g.48545 Transcript_23324/m.48545 type:complete len:248 (+) Transcript_23324:2286-3029(+)
MSFPGTFLKSMEGFRFVNSHVSSSLKALRRALRESEFPAAEEAKPRGESLLTASPSTVGSAPFDRSFLMKSILLSMVAAIRGVTPVIWRSLMAMDESFLDLTDCARPAELFFDLLLSVIWLETGTIFFIVWNALALTSTSWLRTLSISWLAKGNDGRVTAISKGVRPDSLEKFGEIRETFFGGSKNLRGFAYGTTLLLSMETTFAKSLPSRASSIAFAAVSLTASKLLHLKQQFAVPVMKPIDLGFT